MNKDNLRNTFNESILILLYEFFGTFLMSILFINYSQNAKTGKVGNLTKSQILDHYINDQPISIDTDITGNEIDKAPLIMGMFIIILFGARINGSHYNPLITFSFMLGNVRSNKFDRVLGFFYIMAQYAGAMAGGIFQLTINGIT